MTVGLCVQCLFRGKYLSTSNLPLQPHVKTLCPRVCDYVLWLQGKSTSLPLNIQQPVIHLLFHKDKERIWVILYILKHSAVYRQNSHPVSPRSEERPGFELENYGTVWTVQLSHNYLLTFYSWRSPRQRELGFPGRNTDAPVVKWW